MASSRLLAPLALAAAACACACGPKCPEPQYEGTASDEAWLTMQDGESRATADSAKAPVLGFANGADFKAGTLPTWTWSSTLMASRAPAPWQPPPARPASRQLADLFYSSAWAHLPPVTGPIYWFKISVPGEKCPVEVLSTRTEYTPSQEVWTTLGKGSGPRSVTALSAYLTSNRITEGPYKAPSAVTFTVSP